MYYMNYRNKCTALLRVFQFNSCTRKQEYYTRYASHILKTNMAAKILHACGCRVFHRNSAAIANFRQFGGGIFRHNSIVRVV